MVGTSAFQRQMERKRARELSRSNKPMETKMTYPNQVVAYSPNELALAQGTVRGWCAENIRRLLVERREAQENIEQALPAGFKTAAFDRIIAKCERRIAYFKKVGQAIKAGYMIVPNFDMQLFAVRTNERTPKHREHQWANQFVENGRPLPAGEGRYVSPTPLEDSYTYHDGKRTDGTPIEKRSYFPTEFNDEIEFPVALVKPHIIAETQRAMKARVFDQVGVVRGGAYVSRRDDPIVCARIIDPTRNGKAVTFFIAWWLDREMI